MYYTMSCGCEIEVSVTETYGCAGDCCTAYEIYDANIIYCENHANADPA